MPGCALCPLQVTASAARKHRIAADNKMKANVTKRGLVEDPAAAVSATAARAQDLSTTETGSRAAS